MATDSSTPKEQKRIRRIIVLSLALALFGGFFIAKSLTDSGSLKGQAQVQEPSARVPRVADNPTQREEEIISTVRSIIKELKQQVQENASTGHTVADVPEIKKTSSLAQPGAQKVGSGAQLQGTTTKSNTSAGGVPVGTVNPSTPSPFSLPAQFAISGVPHLVIDAIELNAFIRDDRKYVSVGTSSRNIGTAPTIGNTPLKVFLTDAEGNSTLLGEQIIGVALPGSQQSTQSTFSCPQSGDAEICVVVPTEFSITSNNTNSAKVCKRLTIPPLFTPSTTSSSTSSPSTAADCNCKK